MLRMMRVLSSASEMLAVMASITMLIWFILSTILRLEDSTSCIAVSITCTLPPKRSASVAMRATLVSTRVILSKVVLINCNVFVMASVIRSAVTSRLASAFMMLVEEVFVPVLKSRISSATTAKPLPASPALAASMDAFNARRLV